MLIHVPMDEGGDLETQKGRHQNENSRQGSGRRATSAARLFRTRRVQNADMNRRVAHIQPIFHPTDFSSFPQTHSDREASKQANKPTKKKKRRIKEKNKQMQRSIRLCQRGLTWLTLALFAHALVVQATKELCSSTDSGEALADLEAIEQERRGEEKPAAKWGYNGEAGDAFWGELDASFSTCRSGMQQSPVSIPTASQHMPGLLQLHWTPLPAPVALAHLGSAFQVDVAASPAAPDNYLLFNGTAYSLLQFHFHGPSEHRTNGTYYPLEMHAVHRNAAGQLLVVGIFLDYSYTPNAFFEELLPHLPRTASTTTLPDGLRWDALLGAISVDNVWLYSGSLTTPPCSEGVQWVVLDTVVGVSSKFISTHTAAIGFNARHTQPLNGRLVPQTYTSHSHGHAHDSDCALHAH